MAQTLFLLLWVCLAHLLFPLLSFFFTSTKSKYTSRVHLQGAKLIICQWFAPFLYNSLELMTMSLLKSQNLLPWIYKTGPLIWVTISPLSLNSSQKPRRNMKDKVSLVYEYPAINISMILMWSNKINNIFYFLARAISLYIHMLNLSQNLLIL